MGKPSIFHHLIALTQRHSMAIIIMTVLVTLMFLFFATGVEMNPDFNSLLPADDQSNLDYASFYGEDSLTDNIIILLKGDDLYTPDNLAAIEQVVTSVEAFPNVGEGMHPFSMITAQKKGTRLVIIPMSPHAERGMPWTEEDAEIFRQNLLQDEVAKNLMVSEDGTSLLLYFPAKVLEEGNDIQVAQLQEMLLPLTQFSEVVLNGSPVVTDRIMFFLVKDLIVLLGICFVVIMIVYYLSFHAKRAVILPLTVVVFGTIWCLGVMALLGYKLTIINVITPPLVLTLGSSYSIHILNEYYRTHPSKLQSADRTWIIEAVEHVNKTIIIAGLTTVAGFLSLLFTKIEEFKHFGISTSIGIASCVILTLFYLPAVLSRQTNPKASQHTMVRRGWLTRLVKVMGVFIVKYWGYLLLLFAAIIVSFIFSYPNVTFETNYAKYFPKDDPVIDGIRQFTHEIGGVDAIYVTLEAPENEKNYFLRPEVLTMVDAFEQQVREEAPGITHTLSFPTYTRYLYDIMSGEDVIPESPGLILLISRYIKLMKEMDSGNKELGLMIDDTATTITLAYRYRGTDPTELTNLKDSEQVINIIQSNLGMLPADAEVSIWGQSSRFIALSNLMQRDQQISTLISLAIVLLITWVTFGSFGYGVLSLVPIIAGIMANVTFMSIFDIPFDMVTIAFSSVTVGVGIDDAIHFILRFKSLYFYRSGSLIPAVKRTIELTGRPIILTSLSIISGLIMLTFASFVPIRYFGILISIALMNTLLATLFILPSCIILWIRVRRLIDRKLKRI